jgi:hypothetical protein
MSDFTRAFDELYSCQSRILGVVILASISGYGTNVAALLSGVNQNAQFADGTVSESGGYDLKIKQADLSAEPPKGTAVTANGSATGETLQVISAALVNGIWEIAVGDIQA